MRSCSPAAAGPGWGLRYRTPALARRLAERGEPPLTAMHKLLSPLNLLGLAPSGVRVDDVDTPEDAAAWAAGLQES